MVFNPKLLIVNPMDMAAYVRGSKQGKRRGETWKKFYKRKTEDPETCSMEGCDNAWELGAHVRIKERPEVFILPSCKPCYKTKTSFGSKYYDGHQNWSAVKKGRKLVPVVYSKR